MKQPLYRERERVCGRTISLPGTYPKDPADRTIGATAVAEGYPCLRLAAKSDAQELFKRFAETC